MNPRTRWIAFGLLAGFAVAAAVFFIVERRDGPRAVDPDDDERLARIDARLKSIEAAMRAKTSAPRTRTPTDDHATPSTQPAVDPVAERAATVAEVEEFLAKRLKDEDDRPPAEHRFELGVGDAGTKSLDDAAKELGLTPEKTQRVRDAFHHEGEAQLQAAFGTDDIEAIRTRIRDAEHDPAARTKLQDELLGNLLKTLPKIRKAEDEKIRSLKETLGADGYEKFRRLAVRESDVDEFDALFERTFSDAAAGGR
jgi:hypothetical protein